MPSIPPCLDAPSLASALAELDGWEQRDDALHSEFVFADFVAAFAFMSGAALCAERANHHPDWSNSYRTVRVALRTHEADGITSNDVSLAREMNRLAGR